MVAVGSKHRSIGKCVRYPKTPGYTTESEGKSIHSTDIASPHMHWPVSCHSKPKYNKLQPEKKSQGSFLSTTFDFPL